MAWVAAADEGRHPAGPEPLWAESWDFNFASSDASIGGYARLGLLPNLNVAWYWAALIGSGRRLVAVRDHEIDPPRGRWLEVRAQGLWSALNCETPLDHWSVGLEAFAVALDDPAEVFRGERGDVVGLGFDLEWEATSAASGDLGQYGQSCRVSGEILVGDERLVFDGGGHRYHSWGVKDWWASPSCRASGALSDGSAFCGQLSTEPTGTGWVSTSAGLEPIEVTATTTLGPDQVPVGALLRLGALSLAATPVAYAPVVLDAPDGRRSRHPRALCRYQAPDGRAGAGWMEWVQPPAS